MRGCFPCVALAVLAASSPLDAQTASAPSGPLASGLAALAASDYAKAEAELGQVKGSAEPDAKLGLARAAFEQGKFEVAERLVQAASASAATKTKATVLRAEILGQTGRRDEAIRLLDGLKTAMGPEARRARLLLGEYLIDVGKRDAADEPLKKVIEDYNDNTITNQDAEGLAHVGRAAYLLRSPKDANQAFNESERVDKKRIETLLWRAELFLDKYDPGHAEEVVREALAIAPKRADALVALARVKLDQTLDFDSAEKLVAEALGIHPKHAGAFAVRAGLALRDMDLRRADEAIAAGLAVDPGHLELASLKAAIRFLDDDPKGFESAKKDVFARNKSFSQFYGIVGEYAEWEHRYDDIVAMMKDAVKIDPDDGKAWAQLGLTMMRGGDEDKGLEAIRKAWSKDKFNVRVFNTLNMYENDLPSQYEVSSDGVFKLRYAKDERPIMDRYVPRMLGEAWGSMKARYGFVPSVPAQIEMYSSRQQFSVRTSGLPNIAIQGVCFGRVVAAISPKAEPFNWGNVLWHELGHVFAIQLSKNHVPRWFTEGLSEYETIARRPEWARELDPELYDALVENRLPGAVDMNRAFTHAGDAGDMTVAYYAASQMLVWTVEKFGMARVVKALELWGQGKKTPDVIQGAFGVSPQVYDRGFREWALDRLARYKGQYRFSRKAKDEADAKKTLSTSPNDAGAHVDYALALLRGRKLAEAKKEIQAALSIEPKNAHAHFVAAKLALGEKDKAVAASHLDAMRATGSDGYAVHMLLADIAEDADQKDKQRFHLEAAHRYDPSQSDPLKALHDLAHREKREGDEMEALRKLVWLEQHDGKIWRRYLEKLVEQKRWAEARRIGEGAVFVDVLGGVIHTLYARALQAENFHERAVFELESALLCELKPKDKATAHALLAKSLAALKKPAEAQKHKAEALRLDPQNADAN